MKLSASLVALALALGAAADRKEWEQCGGNGWTGETTCASGLVCTYINDWYSQCIKGTAAPSSSAPPTPTSSSPPAPTNGPVTGFVKRSGTKFTLNGSTYHVLGANSYWVGLSGMGIDDMRTAFKDIAGTGATTVRTWGFNDQTDPNYWGPYYQLWTGSTPTVNTGASGLENFDKVVQTAKENGIRLIVALTNNWSDYGGMDVYVKQILGSANHDLFYTDAKVIAAFKAYIKTFVTRYKNEPGILAWELANEPRCKGSTGTTSGTCTPATITKWATDISAYIKSLDSNHLVALGDEGFFNQPGHPSYPYQGSEGIDFVANLKISTIDFGTAHAYPDHWGESANVEAWGAQWIKDHATQQTAIGKPVILEEFGSLNDQSTIYSTWYSAIESSGLAGDLIWQAGSKFSGWSSHDDGYTIYPDDPVYPIQKSHNAKIKARG